jgi:ATP-dependent RNA helicase SUPV3L1/SUV3
VRVDILERLADLIRPALSWREGVLTPKPDGAFDGRGFTVTGAMTSLTGASGEDFASILRSLGYRLDRRPKPPEAKPAEPAEVKPEESAPAPEAVPAIEAATPVVEASAADAAATPAAEPVPAPAIATSSYDLLPATDIVAAPPPTELVEQPAPEQSASEDKNTASVLPENTKSLAEKSADEPVYIDVWRPAGRSEKRPPRPRRQPRPQQAPVLAAPAANGGGATTATAATPASEAVTPDAGTGFPAARPPYKDGPNRQQRQERHERQQRVERQSKGLGQRNERQGTHGGSAPPRGDRPRRDKGNQVERAEREQYYAKPHGSSDRRDKAPDPNSPFAKLAALKQQLEQNNKP